MPHRHSFPAIEKAILRKGLLKIKNFIIPENYTPEKLVDYIIQNNGCRNDTLRVRTDKPQKNGSYGYRSISDLFRIVKFYFPDCSIVTMYNVIISLHKKKKIESIICTNVHKRVYRRNNGIYTPYFESTYDEFGIDFSELPDSTVKNNGNFHESSLNFWKIKD